MNVNERSRNESVDVHLQQINIWSQPISRWLTLKHNGDFKPVSFTDINLKLDVEVPEPEPHHIFGVLSLCKVFVVHFTINYLLSALLVSKISHDERL